MHTFRTVRSFPPTMRLLLVNQLGIDVGFYLLIPYLSTHLSHDLHLSAAATGAILGARQLSQHGLFVVGGTAADRLGAHRVIPFGCAVRTAGFALFAFGDGVPAALAASVLSGLAGALFYPAVRAYVAEAAADRKAEAFALFNVFATTGGLLGLLLGSMLCLIDFRVTALTAAAVFAVLTVAQFFALPEQHVRPASETVLRDWREALGNHAFLAFALTMSGMSALESQVYLLFTESAHRASGWQSAAALLPLVGAVANLLLQLRVTTLTRLRGGAEAWIAPGVLLIGLGFLPPALTDGLGAAAGALGTAVRLAPLVVGVLLLQLGVMVAQPPAMELVARYATERMAGTYFGLFHVLSGTFGTACTGGVGWVMDRAADNGRTWLPWVCCAVLGTLSAGALAFLHRRRALPTDPAVTHA
ncbi:MFS transporter [Streptomyces sp. 5-8]|uniref:MFS transporter n=1 Tax=Streptomyces musisoli TaxID=2802280 RepID=A0ABS1NYN7_9ACTN|nr:MFS transporter [Streptomyces musisoli]MBL1104801.1 MFS transporter [Streptomyces musisoli]